jgi:ADP-heptose:LPS heptosyltransferase
MMKKALLFRLGGLGDLLVAFPSISLIHKIFPSARSTLVCREEYGILLKEAGIVSEVMRGESLRLLPLFSSSVPPGKELIGWLGGFDLIMGWIHGKRMDAWVKNLRAISISVECRFFYYQPEKQEQISRFFFRQTAEALRKDLPERFTFEECCRLPLKPDQQNGRELVEEKQGASFVVVHPGSGSEKKCWPAQNFLGIIELLGRQRVKGAIITGEAEKRIEGLIEKTSLPPGWSWVRHPPLSRLTGLLRKADLYLGNDSGITHLAAACGTEAVALFRDEFVPSWQPYGRVHLLCAGSPEEISLGSVWRKVSGLLHLPVSPI